jgi:hypothetical protein
MRYLLLLASLVPAAAIAQKPSTSPTQAKLKLTKCERPGVRRVDGGPRAGVRKLGEMPPAKPIYTVLREVDGCPKPVSVQRR